MVAGWLFLTDFADHPFRLPAGVWAGWGRHFRVMGRRLRSLCVHWHATLPVFAAAGQPFPPRFWGIGAD